MHGDGAASRTETVVVLQPAGPSGRYRSLVGFDSDGRPRLVEPAQLLVGQEEPELPRGADVIELDLPDASAAARAAGELARGGMAAALLRLGAARLAAVGIDPFADMAELVPSYVTLPRGASAVAGEIRWSHDRP